MSKFELSILNNKAISKIDFTPTENNIMLICEFIQNRNQNVSSYAEFNMHPSL